MLLLRSDTKDRHMSRRYCLGLVSPRSTSRGQRVAVSSRRGSEALAMIDPGLIRILVLNALECPSEVTHTQLTIASYLYGRQSAKLGLEPLAELMGHTGNHHSKVMFAYRRLNSFEAWQKKANVQICKVKRGKRNVREVIEFQSNNLNAIANWIAPQIQTGKPQLPQIDELLESAIAKFLRKPLAVVESPIREKKDKPPTDSQTVQGADCMTADSVFITVAYGLIDQFRVFPVDIARKRPLVWKWIQCATRNPIVINQWGARFPDAGVAILTGVSLEGGGFLTEIDLDRHGNKFGDGFKTVAQRSQDFGPLPPTFTVTTPSGNGEHRRFRSRAPLPTTTSLLGPGLDCKSRYGYVIAPDSYGYTVSQDLPIAWLPEAWETALAQQRKREELVPIGERHDYLRGVSYAMAKDGKHIDEILPTLRHNLVFRCAKGGRTITDEELKSLAISAVKKIEQADRLLEVIVA